MNFLKISKYYEGKSQRTMFFAHCYLSWCLILLLANGKLSVLNPQNEITAERLALDLIAGLCGIGFFFNTIFWLEKAVIEEGCSQKALALHNSGVVFLFDSMREVLGLEPEDIEQIES
jgi:hypothetical protein